MKNGVRFLAVTAAAAIAALSLNPAVAYADQEVAEPDEFTSMFTTEATPDNVVDPDGEAEPGEEGATGTFDIMINSHEEIVCWDITLDGVTPPYESPARTATHVHEGSDGVPGPPRLAFPDPEEGEDGLLRSSGCMQGPFTTGLEDDDDGTDTGEGFTLSQIEDDPSNYNADTHTEDYPVGAVRGQLTQVPHGGMDTGVGGMALTSSGSADAASSGIVAAGSGVLVTVVAGFILLRRYALR